jgi:hypothetical protein
LNVANKRLGFARANEHIKLILEGHLFSNFTNDAFENQDRAIIAIGNSYGESIGREERRGVLVTRNLVGIGHLFISTPESTSLSNFFGNWLPQTQKG